MAETGNDVHKQRPTITLQPYNATAATYTKHGAEDDKLAILVCRIKTWKASGTDWFSIPTDCLTIREVESIEITNSYDELISKAVLHFPRGTVVNKRRRTVVPIDAGNGDNSRISGTLSKYTQGGDFLDFYYQEKDVGKNPVKAYKQLKDIVSLDGKQVQMGLTGMNASKDDRFLLEPDDFRTENRIEIRLGYAYSEEEFEEMMRDNSINPPNMEMVFTGFITKCSASTPLEVECENMAHVLTNINVPDIIEKGACTLKDFLDPKGKYRLLNNTGIDLDLGKENFTIEVANFEISSQLTVADVLHQWQECGIMCFMKNYSDTGRSALRVGKNFYVDGGMGGLPIDKKTYITYNPSNVYNVIQFDWDVAEDRLELMNTDKRYLAVKATGRTKEGKWFGFTLRRTTNGNGDFESTGNDSWQIVNEKREMPKKAHKKKDGTLGKQPKGMRIVHMNKVRTQDLNIIPYIRILPCDRETLLKEAKEYWRKYVPNGVSGSIVIFGDLQIEPADIIALIDPRQPNKNGWYMVKDVNITFGTNGYRKELKLPYKVASFKDFPVYFL